jgi:hypothetical protein
MLSVNHLHHTVELAQGFTVTIDRDPASTAAQINVTDGGELLELWFDAYQLVHWAQAMAALQHGSLIDPEEIYAEGREGGVTVTPDNRLIFTGLSGTIASAVDSADLMLLINLITACSAGL